MRQTALRFDEQLWIQVKDANDAARSIFDRHYSRRQTRRQNEKQFVGPGEPMVLITPNADALFVWRKFINQDNQPGVNCAVFRNEGPYLSSLLIEEACRLAWQKWPGERLYTYVDARKIRSTNPGACFIKAGWTRLKTRTKKRGLVVLEILPASEAQ